MSSYSIINTFAASKSCYFLEKIKFHAFYALCACSVLLLLEFNKLLERKKQFAPKIIIIIINCSWVVNPVAVVILHAYKT